jgi:hypothetical protein
VVANRRDGVDHVVAQAAYLVRNMLQDLVYREVGAACGVHKLIRIYVPYPCCPIHSGLLGCDCTQACKFISCDHRRTLEMGQHWTDEGRSRAVRGREAQWA